jgi:hypothetical protein
MKKVVSEDSRLENEKLQQELEHTRKLWNSREKKSKKKLKNANDYKNSEISARVNTFEVTTDATERVGDEASEDLDVNYNVEVSNKFLLLSKSIEPNHEASLSGTISTPFNTSPPPDAFTTPPRTSPPQTPSITPPFQPSPNNSTTADLQVSSDSITQQVHIKNNRK